MRYLVCIVIDDVFNLCFHISDNLMVHTLCCCFHSSAYKTSISIHKVYYLLVVFRILVAHSTTLHGTAIDKARAVEQCRPIGQ